MTDYTGAVSPQARRIAALRDELDEGSDASVRAAPGMRINTRALQKSYRARKVLKSLDLHINPGEFVAVVGRSGCGKSTLLRLLAGLEKADSGDLSLTASGAATTRVMFQDARLLPWKTIQENVLLGLAAEQPDRAAQSILATVGLAEHANDWPATLSGGQRQRVALARALMHQPSLLLLDEPLGALDALTRIEMQGLIEQLWQQHQWTAVLVTHDVQEAIMLADRVILIEDGRVALDLRIDLARPRRRTDVGFGALEEQVLSRVLQTGQQTGQPRYA